MMPLIPFMQNANGVWLESCGISKIYAASQGQRDNRDTRITLPEGRIRASCLWVSETAFVR
jgi:hypothetical protein